MAWIASTQNRMSRAAQYAPNAARSARKPDRNCTALTVTMRVWSSTSASSASTVSPPSGAGANRHSTPRRSSTIHGYTFDGNSTPANTMLSPGSQRIACATALSADEVLVVPTTSCGDAALMKAATSVEKPTNRLLSGSPGTGWNSALGSSVSRSVAWRIICRTGSASGEMLAWFR